MMTKSSTTGHPHRRDSNFDDDENDTAAATTAAASSNIAVRIQSRPTHVPSTDLPVDYTSLLCGLFAGIAQAGVFNPYDRALYLSVKEHRRFFHHGNWQNPYSGFFQSLGGRAAAGGLYFPLEHFFLQSGDTDTAESHFVAGTAAGAVNACILNPLSAIKYKTWGRPENRGMWTEALGMLRKSSGSLRPFMNGLPPTLYRDIVFGGCYTWLRLQIPFWYDSYLCHDDDDDDDDDSSRNLEDNQWMGNFVAAGLATVVSGPFNYVRNVQYATSSRLRADGTWQVLVALVEETQAQPSGPPRWKFVQSRLRIGWGTARVAAGMTFAQGVYDFTSAKLTTQ